MGILPPGWSTRSSPVSCSRCRPPRPALAVAWRWSTPSSTPASHPPPTSTRSSWSRRDRYSNRVGRGNGRPGAANLRLPTVNHGAQRTRGPQLTSRIGRHGAAVLCSSGHHHREPRARKVYGRGGGPAPAGKVWHDYQPQDGWRVLVRYVDQDRLAILPTVLLVLWPGEGVVPL